MDELVAPAGDDAQPRTAMPDGAQAGEDMAEAGATVQRTNVSLSGGG